MGTCEPAVSRRDGVNGNDHGSLHRDVADEDKLEGQLVRVEAGALLEVVDGHLEDVFAHAKAGRVNDTAV